MSKILTLVPLTAFSNNGQVRGRPPGLHSLSLRHLQVQRREVTARQVISQVRRRQPNFSRCPFHILRVSRFVSVAPASLPEKRTLLSLPMRTNVVPFGNSPVWASDCCSLILLRGIAGHSWRNVCFICSHQSSGRQNSLTDLTGTPRVTRIGGCVFPASSVAQAALCIWVCGARLAVWMQ